MSTRSILLVAQFAPPAGFSASRRIAGITKYLARLGHRVTVLTSLASGRGEIEGAARGVRTRDLLASGMNWRRGHFESIRGGDEAYIEEPSRLASVVVPDLPLVSWLPFVVPRALELARRERFDCVLTSSPPESVHLVGMALRRRGVPWIADLRDGWTFEGTHPDWPLAWQRRLDTALEAAVARRADLVTAVTEPIADDLRLRLGVDAVTLTNGFDPDERAVATRTEVGLDSGRFSLVYTGRLAFARSTPQPLLDAVRTLKDTRPDVAARLEVVLAGPLSAGELEQIGAPDLREHVRSLGNLERESAIALQRAADGLLLVLPPARPRSVATAKLYEYLAAQRPIVVLGDNNTAADIVRETRSGIVTSAHDPVAIAASLARLVDGEVSLPVDRPEIERYSYARIARRLAELIESISASGPS
jgi:glycosyltransferase involved in cell wall biosynthesis